MYVLCLIDFEQIAGLSWVCVATFHIFRLFLIFLALLYICNKFFGPGCTCVCVKKGRGCPPFLFGFLVLFLFDFIHVLVEHIRFPRHSYPDHRFAMRIWNRAYTR